MVSLLSCCTWSLVRSKGKVESDDVSIPSSVGSEIRVALSAVSAVMAIVDEDGVAGVGESLVGAGVHFLDFLGAGHLGHVCESCLTVLHQGQAFSDPGHDAITLNPSKSKNGVAESGVPALTFKTMSQWLDCSEKPLYICGAMATTSPCVDQRFWSCCSTTNEAKTGMLVSLMGTKRDGVPAGGTGCTVKCLHTNREDKKSCCTSLLAKQTSKRDMLAQGTIPTEDSGS